jgi:CDP-6-deoxy-D-xylo-4-hexulose-3-dehydrase
MQPFFEKYAGRTTPSSCPNAELIHNQGLYFGNNPEMTENEINLIRSIFGTTPV